MSIFNQLKQQLSQQLQQLNTPQGIVQLWAEVAEQAEDSTLLRWLKGQNRFPHFFWQARSLQQTFVAAGAVRDFVQLPEAQAFSQQTGLQLVGGLQFEGQCHFILPRLMIAKKSAKLTACLTLDSSNLAEEFAECQAVLQQFEQQVSFGSLVLNLQTSKSAYQFPSWQQNIEQALIAIQQQRLNKVVLANATTFHSDQIICPYALLSASQQKNLGCYHFLWAETAQQTFVGSSPERLYQRQDRQFSTEALAGTVAVTADPEETEANALWLLNDHKNIYENLLVVDDICSHLADCAQDICVGEAEIKRLHNVQHLRRPIQTVLAEQVSDADCLARIHPTAAVAGLPRLPAKQFIQQHEPFSRHWYAGTLGFFSPEAAEFCVTLRSALIQQNQVTLYAGAGIVEESTPEAEWQEIDRKSWAMRGLFQPEE